MKTTTAEPKRVAIPEKSIERLKELTDDANKAIARFEEVQREFLEAKDAADRSLISRANYIEGLADSARIDLADYTITLEGFIELTDEQKAERDRVMAERQQMSVSNGQAE